MKLVLLTLFAIVSLSFLTRFYNLSTNPPSLDWDEVAIGYNAYSINLTGKDEWGTAYPKLFKSFGDYKTPLYIYSVALSQRLFGMTDFSVRFPSALAGITTTLFVFLLASELFRKSPKSSKLALASSFIFAILPWALQFNRAGFEASLALCLVTAGSFLFFVALRSNIFWLFVSLVLFSLSTMSYHNARIFVPLFVGLLFLVNFHFFFKKLIPVALILGCVLILNLPYLDTWFSQEGRARLTSESVLAQEGNVIVNFQQNYVANFSLDYLFFRGDQNGRHSVKKLGEAYTWQLPFFLFGIYLILKQKNKAGLLLIAWLFIAALPPALTKVSPHALRGLLMTVPLAILTAFGLVSIHKNRLLALILLPIFIFSFVLYLHVYYDHYPKAYSADWQDGTKETINFVSKISSNYDQIFVHPNLEPIFLLYYLPFPPAEFQKYHHETKQFGKFVYHDLNTHPTKKNPAKKSLIIAPAQTVPGRSLLLREFRLKNGDPRFSVYEF